MIVGILKLLAAAAVGAVLVYSQPAGFRVEGGGICGKADDSICGPRGGKR
jgi:hypothetical protein